VDEVVLDTKVLIDLTRSQRQATEFARSGPTGRLMLHPAAEAEVLVGARDRYELRRLVAVLDGFAGSGCNRPTSSTVLPPSGATPSPPVPGWPDCLIAATALRLGLPVVTLNDKHFRAIRGLRVIRPY
jgi:predicted nucleic acid-binding protein